MANKGISLNTRFVMPVVVILATLVVSLVLKPEEVTPLFYVNLCFGIFWELVFFAWMAFSRSDTSALSSVFKAVSGGMSLYYVFISFIVMLVYSIGLAGIIHLKWYICILSVLTILWYALGSFVAHYDNAFNARQGVLNDARAVIALDSAKISKMVERCSRIYDTQGVKYKTEANVKNPVEKLYRKMNTITPNVLRNSMAVTQLNLIINTCEELLDALESAENIDAFKSAEEKLERFIKSSVSDVDFLKSTSLS